MKTKLLLCSLLFPFSFLLSPCTAQVPMGFNYQAIARNGNGVPITSQAIPVRISIVTSLTGGTVIWQEDHSSVTADQYGLISLVVGTGTQTGGTAASFSAIDWSAQTLFLKTEVKYPGPGWTDMGTSQIWAVPYSLTAKEVTGPLTKLGITGTTTDMEEALFEVKNQAGNTVFAVYNEGIRAYVGNGSAKGKKGGFAVGGYDATKGTTIYDLLTLNTDSARLYFDSKPNLKGARGGFSVGGYDMTKGSTVVQNYLDVSNDSIRIYIDSNPLTKGKKGGFAVGGYDMTKGTNDNYLNVNTDASGIVNPVNRILWYPNKNAFLAGNIRIGTPDSVGVNSFATGYRSKSRGMYSQAMGFKAIANGDYSTAIGKNAVANSINSFAFGESAIANSSQTYAFGNSSQANALGSFAFGYNAKTTGQDAFALGSGTEAIGQGSFAIGFIGRDSAGITTGNTRAESDWAVAIGMGAQAKNKGAFSVGTQTIASGTYSIALGYKSNAISWYSTALGYKTNANGYSSTAMGWQTTASGYNSTAMGVSTLANNDFSTAMGALTEASGQFSTAMGELTSARGAFSTAMGLSSTASGSVSTAIGLWSKAIGNNSTAIGDHSTAKGVSSTALGPGTTACGYGSTSMGLYTKAKPFVSLSIGQYNDTTCATGGDVAWINTDPVFIIGNGTSDYARENAFTVLKNGNVGIGTATPITKLEVVGITKSVTTTGTASGTGQFQSWTDGSAQGLRAVYSFYPTFQATSDNSPRRAADIVSGFNGGTWGNEYLTFNVGYGGSSNDNQYLTSERMRIIGNGNVGIGTMVPTYKLQVNGSVAGIGAYVNTSDVRFKKDIEPITGALEKIMALQGITFNWDNKADSDFNFDDRNHLGFSAQDLEKVVPQVVSTANDKMQTKSIAYGDLVPLLAEAIKEQQKQIESYKSEIESLQEKVGQIESLQKEINELKSLVNTLIANQTAQVNK